MAPRAHTRHARENLRQAVLSVIQPSIVSDDEKFVRLDKEMKHICNNCDTRTLNTLIRLFEAVYDLKQNGDSRSITG